MSKLSQTTWRTVRLGDLIKIKHGFAFQGKNFSELPTKNILLTPGNFRIGGGYKDEKLKYYDGPIPSGYILSPDDLIVTMTDLSKSGDTLGYSALVPYEKEKKFLHNQRIGLVEKKSNEVNLHFLYYLMWTNKYHHYIMGTATGSTIRHTAPERIQNFEFLLPPTEEEQTRIAEILSAFDEKIENNNRIIKTLEEMAQTIFKEWFVNFRFPGHKKARMVDSELGKIPQGWEVKNVMEIVKRISVRKKYENKTALSTGKVPILDQGQSGCIGYHNDEPGVIASIDEPVVVFTNHTCNYRLITYPFSAIQNVLPYVGTNGYPTLFIYYLTREKVKMQEYKGHWPEFEQQEFVVPPLTLAKEFVSFVKPIVQKMVEAENENQKLSALRDLLLPKLMNGEVRV